MNLLQNLHCVFTKIKQERNETKRNNIFFISSIILQLIQHFSKLRQFLDKKLRIEYKSLCYYESLFDQPLHLAINIMMSFDKLFRLIKATYNEKPPTTTFSSKQKICRSPTLLCMRFVLGERLFSILQRCDHNMSIISNTTKICSGGLSISYSLAQSFKEDLKTCRKQIRGSV